MSSGHLWFLQRIYFPALLIKIFWVLRRLLYIAECPIAILLNSMQSFKFPFMTSTVPMDMDVIDKNVPSFPSNVCRNIYLTVPSAMRRQRRIVVFRLARFMYTRCDFFPEANGRF